MHTSITPAQIAAYQADWSNDEYTVREVNGEHEQHWAVCDECWNIVSLSYTKAEAKAIAARLRKKKGR